MSDSEDSDFEIKSFGSSSDEDEFELHEDESSNEDEPPPTKRCKTTSSPAVWVVIYQCGTYEEAKLYVATEHPGMIFKSKMGSEKVHLC